jgi:hypothetical protein
MSIKRVVTNPRIAFRPVRRDESDTPLTPTKPPFRC